ncbi:MAG: LD-carboxypeptidase [Bacteroidales bacterium]|nr:LD-carboxypeptidase [Bacteroidales bacterium]
MKTPPYLNKEDKITILAPAGKIGKAVVENAIQVLTGWELEVKIGKYLFDNHFQYAAEDEKRLEDLQQALNDETVKAILFARGGYGTIRIIDQLDFTEFIKKPKWLIGFSDITVLHSHLHQNFGIETIHGSMASGLADSFSSEWLYKCLFGRPLNYELETHKLSRKGSTEGILTGGNLAMLCSLLGSKSDIDTNNKILFIEEVGEYLYRLDRMMWTLKRAGKLENLAGLIVGGLTDIKDNESPFGQSAEEIIVEAVSGYDFPVCFGFPAGHQKKNATLILGRNVILSINNKTKINFEL